MPWAGYLDRIRRSDVFVVLAGVTFEKGSFMNRNRITTQNGERWLTVPLRMKNHMQKCIATMQVDTLKPWRRSHLETIRHAYSKAPRFEENWPKIQALYEEFHTPRFMDIFGHNIVHWLREYNIPKRPEQMPFSMLPKVKTDELIAMCQHYGCDKYLSGPLGVNYLEVKKFEEAGIKLEFHDTSIYKPISVLDSWMQTKALF